MASQNDKMSGADYTPQGKKNIVCAPGEFTVGVCGLDHGHIGGMCNGLEEAGAEIGFVYDPDPAKVATFVKKFPTAKPVASREELMEKPEVKMIASAAIPDERCSIGLDALAHGKHYFADKPPMTTQAQVDAARAAVKKYSRRWFCYYAERLHVEAAIYAGQLIREGAIGDVVYVKGWGPHRPSLPTRPDWFFQKKRYGGILTDIGSHQLEQALFYTGAKDARLVSSRIGNLHHKNTPEFEDYGDATFITDTGVPCYISVDWFTPDGLSAWGDGRMFIGGTKGYIELRKYVDIARDDTPDHVYLVDGTGEHLFDVHGKVGYPFFGQMVRDCLDGTDTAMDQEHIFRTIELAIEAEEKAVVIS